MHLTMDMNAYTNHQGTQMHACVTRIRMNEYVMPLILNITTCELKTLSEYLVHVSHINDSLCMSPVAHKNELIIFHVANMNAYMNHHVTYVD